MQAHTRKHSFALTWTSNIFLLTWTSTNFASSFPPRPATSTLNQNNLTSFQIPIINYSKSQLKIKIKYNLRQSTHPWWKPQWTPSVPRPYHLPQNVWNWSQAFVKIGQKFGQKSSTKLSNVRELKTDNLPSPWWENWAKKDFCLVILCLDLVPWMDLKSGKQQAMKSFHSKVFNVHLERQFQS